MNKISIASHWLRYNLLNRCNIVLISEPANWVIKEIAKEIVTEVHTSHHEKKVVLAYSPGGFKNKILHFTSINTLINSKNRIRSIHPSNKVILTWYHITENDPRLSLLQDLEKRVYLFHTTSSITAKKLKESGIDAKKIVLIPQGIHLKIFRQQSIEERMSFKEKLGLPKNRYIIGSFQKDGVGWKEGNIPKFIKGPDIFCSVMKELNKNFPIHVLLTGPARGYVKKELTKAGISFSHFFLKNYYDVVDYYNVLDVYMITSRIEGGPRAILESMACGVPLVSSRVGMAPDIIRNGENAFLTNIDTIMQYTEGAGRIFSDPVLKASLIFQGFITARRYNYPIIVQRYFDELYSL